MPFLHVTPIDTGLIEDNVYAVKTGTVSFFVYKCGENIICFDSGFGINNILRGLKGIGLRPYDVKYLFLTHSDFDHALGLKLFKNAIVYFSAGEEQMIKGKVKRKWFIRSPRIRKPYNLLRDGNTINIGETTIKAIETPGHTPGSMSYIVNGKILFSGDAFKLANGGADTVRPFYTMDTRRQIESIKKLAKLEGISVAYTAHWGYTKDYKETMREWRL